MSSNRKFVTARESVAPHGIHAIWHTLSRYSSLLLLLIVCGVTAGLGVFVMRDLRTADMEAQQMYAGAVLGFRLFGQLQYEAQETRRSTLYALTTNDSNLQVEYADQSRAADGRVRDGISEYLKQADNPAEIKAGERLRDDWSAYLKVRDEVLASILEGSTKEAVKLDLEGGVPSFDRVRKDLETIKRLYNDQASEQLAIVDESSRRSVVRLLAVITLTVLFASVSIWIVHRSRMMVALQIARLQMDFVASVSHELRTPLSVIRSAAENITDGVITGPEQLTRYGAMIRSQTRQITELVNQILLFASTRDGRKRYVFRPVQVSQIIEGVLENTLDLMREEGIALESHIQDGLPAVIADAPALSQCIQNLVVNAIKYSGTNKWIGIYADRMDGQNEIQIRIKDRGIGIAASDLKRIFEPFYRSPAVCTAQVHGTGLGLPLAKRIAEAMGGSVSVSSELGRGSIFTVHLPVAEASDVRTAAANVVA
ncbi:MAG TPA: ATP-binding protein [Terriglobales bacterium]|nr:ATP-binding protein [Terriglobales bacterium]